MVSAKEVQSSAISGWMLVSPVAKKRQSSRADDEGSSNSSPHSRHRFGGGDSKAQHHNSPLSTPRSRRRSPRKRALAGFSSPSSSPSSPSSSSSRSCYWTAYVWVLAYIIVLLTIVCNRTLGTHIGFQAGFVCVTTFLIPLIHPHDFHNAERLQATRRRLDVSDALNTAPPISKTEDLVIPSTKANHSIPIRLYRPLHPCPKNRTIVWVHGGGWTIGSIAADDKIARRLAAATGATVASVEYRLAPEHKYPAQLEDTVDALEYLLTHGHSHGLSTKKVAVMGESAGGHLTIVSALALDSAKDRLCGIMPIVPATDYGCESESCNQFNKGYLLTQEQVKAFWNAKLHDPVTQQHDYMVSPLRAPKEVLKSLPPMLVMTAALDPLRDEGEAFVQRAREAAGGSHAVQHIRFDRTIHGFFGRLVTHGSNGIAKAAEWFDQTCA